MNFKNKDAFYIILLSLALAFIAFLMQGHPLIKNIQWKAYDQLLKIDYKIRPRPREIKDILIISIGNETLNNMPYSWPYPRSTFAEAISRLKNAGAKVIGLDFAFLGKPENQDDVELQSILKNSDNLILGTMIDEKSQISTSGFLSPAGNYTSGFTTKLQDYDGVVRRNLTYMVGINTPSQGLLSWELQLLNKAKGIDLLTLKTKADAISFQSQTHEKWNIPVEKNTKSFLIHFRAHTSDFKRISFYKILNGDFNPNLIKDKIVLIGTLSLLLQDIHNTPLGWLPGVTLNANAFLTLYAHNFLRPLPKIIEITLIIISVIIAAFFVSLIKSKYGVREVIVETVIFFAISYIFLINGYIFNYGVFLISVCACPFLAKKMYLSLYKKTLD